MLEFGSSDDVVDADGDDVSLTYSWRVGQDFLEESSDTLSGPFVYGSEVGCARVGR